MIRVPEAKEANRGIHSRAKLAAMTFPAILHATDSLWSGLAALVAGVLVAWFSGNLFLVAASGCVVVFLVELLL